MYKLLKMYPQLLITVASTLPPFSFVCNNNVFLIDVVDMPNYPCFHFILSFMLFLFIRLYYNISPVRMRRFQANLSAKDRHS